LTCGTSTAAARAVVLAVVALTVCGSAYGQAGEDAAALLEKFKRTTVFYRQREVAEQLVALHDTRVLQELEDWLKHEDRHVRANAAFVFARLGDARGREVIPAILADRSSRPEGQAILPAAGHCRGRSCPTGTMPFTCLAS
jgi:HEAT repeat protein